MKLLELVVAAINGVGLTKSRYSYLVDNVLLLRSVDSYLGYMLMSNNVSIQLLTFCNEVFELVLAVLSICGTHHLGLVRRKAAQPWLVAEYFFF